MIKYFALMLFTSIAFCDVQLALSVGGSSIIDDTIVAETQTTGLSMLSTAEDMGVSYFPGLVFDIDIAYTVNRFAALGFTMSGGGYRNEGHSVIAGDRYEITDSYSRMYSGVFWRFNFREIEEYLGYFCSVGAGLDELFYERSLIDEANNEFLIDGYGGTISVELTGGSYYELTSILDVVSEFRLRVPTALELSGDVWQLNSGEDDRLEGSVTFEHDTWYWGVSIGLMLSI